jgi:hypothetical protein
LSPPDSMLVVNDKAPATSDLLLVFSFVLSTTTLLLCRARYHHKQQESGCAMCKRWLICLTYRSRKHKRPDQCWTPSCV